MEVVPWLAKLQLYSSAAAGHGANSNQVIFWTKRSELLHWSGDFSAKHLSGDLFLSPVHLILKDEVKHALPSGASSIQWSPAYCLDRRPPPCSSSLYCGKTHTGHPSECSVLLLDGIVAVSREADKQAQESVTSYYITRNAAEPHDMVSRCWRDCSVLLVGNAHIRHLFLSYRGCGLIWWWFMISAHHEPKAMWPYKEMN